MAQKGGGREAEQMPTEECTLSANTDWVLPMCPQGAGGIIIMRWDPCPLLKRFHHGGDRHKREIVYYPQNVVTVVMGRR